MCQCTCMNFAINFQGHDLTRALYSHGIEICYYCSLLRLEPWKPLTVLYLTKSYANNKLVFFYLFLKKTLNRQLYHLISSSNRAMAVSVESLQGFLWITVSLPSFPVCCCYLVMIIFLAPIWQQKTSPLQIRPVSSNFLN